MTPYTGLTINELTGIRKFLVEQMTGDVFQSTNVPGLQSARRLESLADVRQELLYVNQELATLDPKTYGGAKRITRTVFRA